jgi:putative endonuclease
MFSVYAIESLKTERIYIGYTKNIDERIKYHNSGYVKSTFRDRPWRIVALEKVKSKKEARWLERSLKKSRGKRISWLDKNLLS